MKYKTGDIIEIDIGKEYTVINDCTIDNINYHMVLDNKDITKPLIIKEDEESNKIIFVKEAEEIKNALSQMSK